MITVANQANVYDLRGLSTDKKPTENIGGGSTFLEIDTSHVYIFDITTKQWLRLD